MSGGRPAVLSALIEQNHDVGVFIAGSDATIDATVVRATQRRPAGMEFGDGILMVDERGQSSAALTATAVTDNAHAGERRGRLRSPALPAAAPLRQVHLAEHARALLRLHPFDQREVGAGGRGVEPDEGAEEIDRAQRGAGRLRGAGSRLRHEARVRQMAAAAQA
jgi:hypothetical protein